MSEHDQIDSMLDPEMRPIVEAMRQRMAERTPMISISPPEMRARAAADFAVWNADPPPVGAIESVTLDLPSASLPGRLYVPSGARTPGGGLLVHFHGGGWVIGDLDTEDRACRIVAEAAAVPVLSVAYRLSPEVKFPGPVNDCTHAILWARAHARDLGASPDKIAAGGASAGANLAMGAALALRDMGEAPPVFLALLYGAFLMRTETESYRTYGNGRFGLGSDAMNFFMDMYLSSREDRTHPYASPADGDMKGMPGAFLAVAGMDPLRDDSFALGNALRAAGVAVSLKEYDGVIHGFTQFSMACGKGQSALEDLAAALKAAVGS